MNSPINLAWKIAEREFDFLIHQEVPTSENYGAGKAFFFNLEDAITIGVEMGSALDKDLKWLNPITGEYLTVIV